MTPIDIKLHLRQCHLPPNARFKTQWIEHDPIASHFAHVMSVGLEQLESFVIAAVKRSHARLPASRLREQASVFLLQEQQHQAHHHRFNQFLSDQGYAHVSRTSAMYQSQYGHLLTSTSESDFKSLCRLACQFEHCAATVGRYFLNLCQQSPTSLDPVTAYLFAYHAVEECEHKGVCFDCFTTLFGESPMAGASAQQHWQQFTQKLQASTVHGVRYFMHLDHLERGAEAPDEAMIYQRLWGQTGILGENSDYGRYAEPGFHPWDCDDRALIQAWDNHLEPQWRERVRLSS